MQQSKHSQGKCKLAEKSLLNTRQTSQRRILIGRKDADNDHFPLLATRAAIWLPVKKPVFGQGFTLSFGKQLALFEAERFTSQGKLLTLAGISQETELPDFTEA